MPGEFGIGVSTGMVGGIVATVMQPFILVAMAVAFAVSLSMWIIDRRREKLGPRRKKRRFVRLTKAALQQRVMRLAIVFYGLLLVTIGCTVLAVVHGPPFLVMAIVAVVLLLALFWHGRFLWRRSQIPWTHPTYLNFTSFGSTYTVLTVLLGALAMQTGLNLVIAMFSIMLTLILVSGMLAVNNFRGIDVIRAVPSEIFAGESVRIGVRVRNGKRWLPAFSLWLTEGWPEGVPEPDVLPTTYALRIERASETTLNYEMIFPQRGVFEFQGFTITTRFPFSLFTRFHYVKQEQAVTVYPRIRPLPEASRIRAEIFSAAAVAHSPLSGPRSTEFFGLRDYRIGHDDVRAIHWPTTARLNRPVVREFERESSASRFIVLEPLPPGNPLESAIERAAALILDSIRHGFPFTLAIAPHPPVDPPSLEREHRNACLEILARYPGTSLDAPPNWPIASPTGAAVGAHGEADASWSVDFGSVVIAVGTHTDTAFADFLRRITPVGVRIVRL